MKNDDTGDVVYDVIESPTIFLRGGSKATFLGESVLSFGHRMPLMIRETFGEVSGPRRPTVSEPRHAQKLGVNRL